jgi:UDP-N-acetylglucosamine:LPS N-acetylglucosamine transferase
LLALEPWWRDRERTWVTFRTPDAVAHLKDERTVWAFHPTTRSGVNALRNFWLALRTIPAFRPDVIISTGAGVALPFFVVGRLRAIPTVYVEVYDRIELRTLTGRLCRPFTSLFCVQWEEQRLLYPEATLIGSLL